MSFEFPSFRPWLASRHARIAAHASFVPARSVTNQEIIERHGHRILEGIVRRTTGVSSRHVADPGLADSDLLAHAARSCLAEAGLPVESLSKLIVNKFLGDRILPPTASILQRKLGSSLAFQCLDVDGGSNGFLQALDLAARCIGTGDEAVLIAAGGICHSLTSRADPRTAFLFGDGAAALLLEASDEQHLLAAYHFSNPEYADLFQGVAFHKVASIRGDQDDRETALRDLYAAGNWKDAQDFVLLAARATTDRLLEGAGIPLDEVDRVLVAAPAGPLRDAIVAQLGVSEDRAPSLLATHGHTMSASLPLLYAASEREAPSEAGQITLFLSIGEGISGGGILYRH